MTNNTENSEDEEPFRVDFILSTPIVLPEIALHLDAILGRAAFNEVFGSGFGCKKAIASSQELPLAKDGEVWCASCIELKPLSAVNTQGNGTIEAQVVPRIRITNPNRIIAAKNNGRIDGKLPATPRDVGEFRSYDMRIFVQWCSARAWGIGNIENVTSLLQKIPSLGKLAGEGWGRIESFSVTKDSDALERWKQRALPANRKDLTSASHHPAYGNWTAPYWRKENWGPIFDWHDSSFLCET